VPTLGVFVNCGWLLAFAEKPVPIVPPELIPSGVFTEGLTGPPTAGELGVTGDEAVPVPGSIAG